jgi:hypothetical protein
MNDKKKLDESKLVADKQSITRRDAIRKMGYAAFAASTLFLLLNNPTKAHAQSPGDDNPGGPGDDWGDDW